MNNFSTALLLLLLLLIFVIVDLLEPHLLVE